jgi:hypothetical protein
MAVQALLFCAEENTARPINMVRGAAGQTGIHRKITSRLLLAGRLLVVAYSEKAFLETGLSPLRLGHWPARLLALAVGNPLFVQLASGQTAIAHEAFVRMVPSSRGTFQIRSFRLQTPEAE